MSFIRLVRSILLALGVFVLLNGEQPLIGQAAKDKAKKKGDLLVPDPLELKAGAPLSNMAMVSQPAAVKGALSWTVETKRHRGQAVAVDITPDGSLIATSGYDGNIHIWDTATGKLLRVLVGHNAHAHGMAFSPDGQTLATTSQDATARIWNPRTGMTLRVLKKHKGFTSRVDWSPDGTKLVVTGGSSGFATFWDPVDNKQIRTVEHGVPVMNVALSPDGKYVACGTSGGALLWNAVTGIVVTTIEVPGKIGYGVSWSPDSATLAVGGRATILLWDVAGAKVAKELNGNGNVLSWSPDGELIAAGSGNNMAIFNVKTGNRDKQINFNAVGYAWDKSGTRLVAVSHQDVMVVDIKGDRGERTFPVASAASFNWSPGRPILSGINTPTLASWDALTGRPVASYAGHTERIVESEWSRDGKLLATASTDKTARIWEAKSGKLLQTLGGHGDAVTSLAWAPDGRLATACRDKIVRVFPADPVDQPKEFKGHTHPVRAIAWSRDGATLASAGDDGLVIYWDLSTGQPKQKITIDKEKGVLHLGFSLDGRLLAAGCVDANVRIFNVPAGKLVTTFDGRSGVANIHRVAWSADAQQVATTIYYAQVWDLKTSATVQRFQNLAHVDDVSWSADGKSLITVCFDRTLRFVDAVSARTRVTMILDAKQLLAVAAEGHYRAAADLDHELVYVVQTDKTQDTYEPKAFAAKFPWKNNPAAVKP